MSSSINVNITALTTQRYLATSQSALAISMQRLSSGLRINSAKDDAAGLAIGSNMTTLIRCQTVAMRNANDEISLSQTKEGALGKMGDLLQRMRELAVQAPNATNSDNDRAYLNTEFVQMQDELQRIRKGTSFNGTKVFADNALDPTLPNCTLTGTKTTVSAGVNDTLQVTLNGVSANVTLAAGELHTDCLGLSAAERHQQQEHLCERRLQRQRQHCERRAEPGFNAPGRWLWRQSGGCNRQ